MKVFVIIGDKLENKFIGESEAIIHIFLHEKDAIETLDSLENGMTGNYRIEEHEVIE